MHCKNIYDSPRFSIGITVAIVLFIQLILSIFLSLELNIWLDEAWTLDTTGADLKYALWQSIRGEIQAPLYFILLKLWRYLNGSIFFARMFSCLAVLMVGFSCVELSKRYFNNLPPIYLVLSVSLNPFAIWASSEIRLYALLILLVCIHMIFFHEIFIIGSRSKVNMFWYVVTSIAGMYVQYYFGFLILSNFAYIITTGNRKILEKFFTLVTIIAVGFIPIIKMMIYQISVVSGGASSGDTFYYQTQIIYWRLKEYILPIHWGEMTGKYLFIIVLLFLSVIVLKNRKHIEAKQKYIFIQIIVMVLCFFLAIQFTGTDLMYPRHMAVIFIPLLLAVWAAFDTLHGKINCIVRMFWTMLFVLCYVVTLINNYSPMAKPGDWKRAAKYIMENERPEEPVIVFLKEGILPLQHYYRGKNLLVPIPSDMNLSSYDLKSFILKDDIQIIDTIRRVGGRYESLWILNYGPCKYMGTDFRCEVLEDLIRKYYVVKTTQEYYGVKIRRVELLRKFENLPSG